MDMRELEALRTAANLTVGIFVLVWLNEKRLRKLGRWIIKKWKEIMRRKE